MRIQRALVLVAALALACEDGPDQLFRPNLGDPTQQNGYVPAEPWTVTGTTSFEDQAGGSDAAGRAKFCTELEKSELLQRMVRAPILPDIGVGGINMRGPDGRPLHADELVGKPSDGKFCEPDGVYADAFTWGPTNEIIVYFNQDTRLVESAIAYTDYLGTLEGDFTQNGQKVHISVKSRERLTIDGTELDQYTARAGQADRPNAWLNYANVNKFYRMIRETFFQAAPFPADYDCIAAQVCDLVYTTANEAQPQDTFIVLQDSGLQVRFSPDGYAYFVYLDPVRGGPFERQASIRFGDQGAPIVNFQFNSQSQANCSIGLDAQLTFAQFKDRCIAADDVRTLSRGTLYDVYTARDAVEAQFNSLQLHFQRQVSTSSVFRDGEAPKDTDVLFGVSFDRALNAPVEEFRPVDLGNAYKTRLEARLLAAISDDGPISRDTHPLAMYRVRVPFLINTPQRIGELTVGDDNWVTGVVQEIIALYHSLPTEQQAMVDPRVGDQLFLIEPFTDAVIDTLSHNEANAPGAVKFFRTTDDRRWSIGDAHFVRAGVPYRLQVQYSLNYAAVSYVDFSRGGSELDTLFQAINEQTPNAGPYLTLDQLREAGPWGLNGDAIAVTGFDRRLNTLRVELARPAGDPLTLTVPGTPIEDVGGYQKQIRGERYEFVPANVVSLLGRESQLDFYVEADGAIGRIDQRLYKGNIELCPGLSIGFGEDVPQAVQAWAEASSPDAYRSCEIVFNYTANGNVLDSVASIANRVKLTLFDRRAVTASVWR